ARGHRVHGGARRKPVAVPHPDDLGEPGARQVGEELPRVEHVPAPTVGLWPEERHDAGQLLVQRGAAGGVVTTFMRSRNGAALGGAVVGAFVLASSCRTMPGQPVSRATVPTP